VILELSEQQLLLQETFAKLFARESTPLRVRAVQSTGFDAELWNRLVEMQAPLMRTPEEAGGGSMSLFDALVVAEQVGRHLASVPLIESLVTSRLLGLLGSSIAREWLERTASGKAIVIEYLKGQMTIFDAPLGVITNAPSYDWHETNLRNYINLSPVGLPGKDIGDLNFKPLGGGSGMIGLPGDFTPPSRFVRAVAFSKTARPTPTGGETIYEIFRILDNFNVPLGASEGTGEDKTQGMRSSTIWTSASDTNDKVFYYHTQHNRRVRMVDLKRIDFSSFTDIKRLPLDKVKAQDIEDVTP